MYTDSALNVLADASEEQLKATTQAPSFNELEILELLVKQLVALRDITSSSIEADNQRKAISNSVKVRIEKLRLIPNHEELGAKDKNFIKTLHKAVECLLGLIKDEHLEQINVDLQNSVENLEGIYKKLTNFLKEQASRENRTQEVNSQQYSDGQSQLGHKRLRSGPNIQPPAKRVCLTSSEKSVILSQLWLPSKLLNSSENKENEAAISTAKTLAMRDIIEGIKQKNAEEFIALLSTKVGVVEPYIQKAAQLTYYLYALLTNPDHFHLFTAEETMNPFVLTAMVQMFEQLESYFYPVTPMGEQLAINKNTEAAYQIFKDRFIKITQEIGKPGAHQNLKIKDLGSDILENLELFYRAEHIQSMDELSRTGCTIASLCN